MLTEPSSGLSESHELLDALDDSDDSDNADSSKSAESALGENRGTARCVAAAGIGVFSRLHLAAALLDAEDSVVDAAMHALTDAYWPMGV